MNKIMKNVKIILAALAVSLNSFSFVEAMNQAPTMAPREAIDLLDNLIERLSEKNLPEILPSYEYCSNLLKETLQIVAPDWSETTGFWNESPGSTYTLLTNIASPTLPGTATLENILVAIDTIKQGIPVDENLLSLKILKEEYKRIAQKIIESQTGGWMRRADIAEIQRAEKNLSFNPIIKKMHSLVVSAQKCANSQSEISDCIGMHNACIRNLNNTICDNRVNLENFAITGKLPTDADKTLVKNFVALLQKPTAEFTQCINKIPGANITTYSEIIVDTSKESGVFKELLKFFEQAEKAQEAAIRTGLETLNNNTRTTFENAYNAMGQACRSYINNGGVDPLKERCLNAMMSPLRAQCTANMPNATISNCLHGAEEFNKLKTDVTIAGEVKMAQTWNLPNLPACSDLAKPLNLMCRGVVNSGNWAAIQWQNSVNAGQKFWIKTDQKIPGLPHAVVTVACIAGICIMYKTCFDSKGNAAKVLGLFAAGVAMFWILSVATGDLVV